MRTHTRRRPSHCHMDEPNPPIFWMDLDQMRMIMKYAMVNAEQKWIGKPSTKLPKVWLYHCILSRRGGGSQIEQAAEDITSCPWQGTGRQGGRIVSSYLIKDYPGLSGSLWVGLRCAMPTRLLWPALGPFICHASLTVNPSPR
ncbi:hypothetical protein QQF64_003945 [Cirrhinus molitorella]|uniref:Uncharacterized protein n=1 Tax=Cirrhinus molitorella TaxID=172907 RepID=A0ABR3MMR0_9TELE